MIFIDIKSHKNSLLENTEYRSIFYYMHKRSKNKFDKFKIRKIERERERGKQTRDGGLCMLSSRKIQNIRAYFIICIKVIKTTS
jgi:hypothetical protein